MACHQANKNNAARAADSAAQFGPPHAKGDRIFPADTTNGSKIKFNFVKFDMGVVLKGKKVTIKYSFTNTGKKPLMLTDASASCGCTTPHFNKRAVAPGGSDTITVVFDSSDYRPGKVDQQLIIFSNAAPGDTGLFLKGEVKLP